MIKNRLITPEGTRDLLFEDCIARRKVESAIKEVLIPRGFAEVITPALEFYDVFCGEHDGIPRRRCTSSPTRRDACWRSSRI